jgi:Tn3 transposase DDE domain/Homeodomain-like domain
MSNVLEVSLQTTIYSLAQRGWSQRRIAKELGINRETVGRYLRLPKPAISMNQELTMLALHLLQICLVYINTLMIQRVLTEPDWTQRMLPEDLRALTPLIYAHVTPYGTFRLDMNQRLAIEQDAVAA